MAKLKSYHSKHGYFKNIPPKTNNRLVQTPDSQENLWNFAKIGPLAHIFSDIL